MHWLSEMPPVAFSAFPTVQEVQFPNVVSEGAYDPPGQSVHSDAPSLEKLPSGQVVWLNPAIEKRTQLETQRMWNGMEWNGNVRVMEWETEWDWNGMGMKWNGMGMGWEWNENGMEMETRTEW